MKISSCGLAAGNRVQRRQLIVATVFDEEMGAQSMNAGLGGVMVEDVVPDERTSSKEYLPGHPDANAKDRGDVVVMNDNYGVRITEISPVKDRLKNLSQ